MILIKIGQAVSVANSLEDEERKVRRLHDQTMQVSRQLGHLSGMYQVQRKLEDIMDDMQEEYRALKQMSQCMEMSCRAYRRREERITDHAEEAKMIAAISSAGFDLFPIPSPILALLR